MASMNYFLISKNQNRIKIISYRSLMPLSTTFHCYIVAVNLIGEGNWNIWRKPQFQLLTWSSDQMPYLIIGHIQMKVCIWTQVEKTPTIQRVLWVWCNNKKKPFSLADYEFIWSWPLSDVKRGRGIVYYNSIY
jgi:hypothetical protein